MNKQKYNNIKKILRKQVENQVNSQWAWIKDNEGNTIEFCNMFRVIPDVEEIYTPQQLLNKLELEVSD